MKKVLLILMLGVFATATSGTNEVSIDCFDYAKEEATAGTMWLNDNGFATNRFTALDLLAEAYDDCQNGITGGGVWIAG